MLNYNYEYMSITWMLQLLKICEDPTPVLLILPKATVTQSLSSDTQPEPLPGVNPPSLSWTPPSKMSVCLLYIVFAGCFPPVVFSLLWCLLLLQFSAFGPASTLLNPVNYPLSGTFQSVLVPVPVCLHYFLPSVSLPDCPYTTRDKKVLINSILIACVFIVS